MALRRNRFARTLLSLLILATLGVAAPGARADSLDPPQLLGPAADAALDANPVFTWERVPRATRYRIQVSTTAAFSSTAWTADVFGGTAEPSVDLPLGSLHWRVATIHGSEVGIFSSSQTFTRVQAAAPVLVGPVNGATLTYPTDAPVLSWQPIAGMKEYRVEIDDEATFTGASVHTTTSTSLALPTALASHTPRFWRVQGVSTNASVTTAWSDGGDLRSFSIAWPVTALPTLLAPSDSLDVDRDDFELSWTPVPGAKDYEIQTSLTQSFTEPTSVITNATRYRPLNTMKQDQMYWRVRARRYVADPAPWSAISAIKREWLDADGQAARPTMTITDADPLTLPVELEQDRISVSWTAVRRATYYELQISPDSSFNSTATRTCKTPHTSWTPYLGGAYTGAVNPALSTLCAWAGTPTSLPDTRFLVPNTVYYARVRAVDQTPAGGTITSLWSNLSRPGANQAPAATTFTITPKSGEGTDPSQPAVLMATPDSTTTPMLRWQPVEGAQAYLVAMARDSSFNNRAISGYAVTTNTEFILNQAIGDNSVGQPYFWFVLPCTRWDGTSDNDNTCNVGDNQAINIDGKYGSFNKLGLAVEGLESAPVQTDTVALSWQDQLITSPEGSGFQWYEVEVRNAADQVVDLAKTDATGYTPVAKTYPDGQYTWRVRAIDASGTGLEWSAANAFEKLSSIPAPQAPAEGTTLPVLRWSPTSFAASYDVEVYRGVDPDFPAGNKVGESSVTARRYPAATPVTDIPADTYSWRVRQVDAAGNPGPWSTAILPFTIGGTAPTLTAPANNDTVHLPSLVFGWSEVTGAVRYKFESSTTQGFSAIHETITTTANTFAPTKIYSGGIAYYWRVSALNGDSDILATSAPRTVTPLTVPATPVVTTGLQGAKLKVSWPAPHHGGSPLTGYVVRYRPAGTTPWTEVTAPGDALSVELADLEASQQYEIQVAAENAVGLGLFSILKSYTMPPVPGPPTQLKLTAATRGFTVTWAKPTTGTTLPITGYVVRWSPSSGGPTSETAVTGTQATITGLADSATYTVEVAAENELGRGAFVSAEGTTLPPEPPPNTVITSGPAHNAYVGTRSVSFTFSGSPVASTAGFECNLDGGGYEPCASPKSLSDLADGSHTLFVRAKDADGDADETPEQRTFTVDVAAPDTAITTGPPASTDQISASFTYSGSVGDADRFECKLDAGSFEPCAATGRTYSVLAVGMHTFSVRAVDRAGNADPSPPTHQWTIVSKALATTPIGTGTTTTGDSNPVPTGTGDGTTSADGGAGLEDQLPSLPSAAKPGRNGRSITITLPSNGLPDGTTLRFGLTTASTRLASAARTVTIGTGRTTVAAGLRSKVTIRLSAKAGKALKRKGKIKARLTVTASAPNGATAKKSRALTLKRR